MAKSFSIQLDDIATPATYDRANRLTEASGRSEGEAKVKAAEANIGLVKTIFDVGEKAVSGYGEAQIAKGAKASIEKYEDSPDNTTGRKAAAMIDEYDRQRAEQMGDQAPQAGDAPEDPNVAMVREKAVKYRVAESQGLLTREQVISNVTKDVKQWSALLPGFQSEFRKAAFNEVGISNIDVFQIHQALTTEGERDRAAQRAAIAQEKYVADVASHYGVPPTAVTDDMAKRFASLKGLQDVRDNLKAQLETGTVSGELAGRVLDKSIGIQHASNTIILSDLFTEWGKANLDPAQSKRRDELAAQINGSITSMRIGMDSLITNTGRMAGLGQPELEPRSKYANSQYDTYEKLLKTQEGFDTLRLVVGRDKEAAEDMMHRFTLATPMLSAYGRLNGVASEMFKVLMTPGGEKVLRKELGPAATNRLITEKEGIVEWARLYTRMNDPKLNAEHGPLDLNGPETRSTITEDKHIAFNDALTTFRTTPTLKDISPEKRLQWENSLGVITNSIRPGAHDATNKWLNEMDSPDVQREIALLPQPTRAAIAAPIFERYVDAARGNMGRVREMVEEFNNNEQEQRGNVLSVEQGPRGNLILVTTPSVAPTASFNTEESGAATRLTVTTETGGERPPGYGTSPLSTSITSVRIKARAQQVLDSLNTNVGALGAAHNILSLNDEKGSTAIGSYVVEGLRLQEFDPSFGFSPAEDRAIARKAAAEKAAEAKVAEPINEKKYVADRDAHLFLHEASNKPRLTAYDDGKGNVTIGVGFNMNAKGAAKIMKEELGIDAEEFTRIKEGAQKISEPQAKKLYERNTKDSEAAVKKAFGDTLSHDERLVAVSLSFNGSLKQPIIDALKNKDYKQAVEEILYRSYTAPALPGTLKRRYEEAGMIAKLDRSITLPSYALYKKGNKPIRRADAGGNDDSTL